MRKLVGKYKSKFEHTFAAFLKKKGLDFQYESVVLLYTEPQEHKYHVDWASDDYQFYIETKGRFTAKDRRKHLAVRVSNPGKEVRFVFQNARQRLYKGSPNTYADWCNANGFKWAQGVPPAEWFLERVG